MSAFSGYSGSSASLPARYVMAPSTNCASTLGQRGFGCVARPWIVASNVVMRSSPPSTTATRAPLFPTWTWEQLGVFLDHVVGHPLAAAITFAALTGARRGEVIGLRWCDVD